MAHMPTFYIAGSWLAKAEARAIRDRLSELHVGVSTARWIDSPESDVLPSDPKVCQSEAERDIEDIDRADVFLLLTNQPSSSGGMHVELGIALAKQKAVVILGRRTNVFHHLPAIQVIERLEELGATAPPLTRGDDGR